MNLEEAGRTLRKMYDAAPHGGKVAHIHLFGIKHADELDGLTSKDIVVRSGIKESYHAEVSKGRNLAKYVVVRVLRGIKEEPESLEDHRP